MYIHFVLKVMTGKAIVRKDADTGIKTENLTLSPKVEGKTKKSKRLHSFEWWKITIMDIFGGFFPGIHPHGNHLQ